jgi:predicted O-methyltransferase YrrM
MKLLSKSNNNFLSFDLLKKEDIRLLFIVSIILFSILLLVLITLNNSIIRSSIISLLGTIILTTLITIQLNIYSRTEELLQKQSEFNSQKRGEIYRQTEALFSIFSILNPEIPLPSMNGWTINPDFAITIINNIILSKPSIILEMGSGVSTVIAAYSLKKIGGGKIISLEHEQEFVEKNLQKIREHNLQEFAEIIYAPLKKWSEGTKEWLWYDTAKIEQIDTIDLVIVDGPPRKIQEMSRYPALPILFNKLSHNSVIILDDFKRKDMNTMIDLWLSQFPDFQQEIINTKSGCLILRKNIQK